MSFLKSRWRDPSENLFFVPVVMTQAGVLAEISRSPFGAANSSQLSLLRVLNALLCSNIGNKPVKMDCPGSLSVNLRLKKTVILQT